MYEVKNNKNKRINMISITENTEQDSEIVIDEKNIFYVVSKIKNSENEEIEIPRIGKIKESDEDFFQSFYVADNPLILNEFITTTTILTQDIVLYFFISLNAINFLIEDMEKIKEDEILSAKYKDLSSKYNILKHKKDIWIYFHHRNIKKYTLLFANDFNQISDFLESDKVKIKPCIIASLNDLNKIKENMLKIISGEEKRFNKIESIDIE